MPYQNVFGTPSSLSLEPAAAEKPRARGLLDERRDGLEPDHLEAVPSLESFLHEHAISEAVGSAGRYIRFERGEYDKVAPHFADCAEKIRRFTRTVVGQEGGFVIVRQGWGAPVAPQLRPDAAVIVDGRMRPSYHPSDPSRTYTYWTTKKGERFKVRALPHGEQRERHILKHHEGENVEGLHFTPSRPAKSSCRQGPSTPSGSMFLTLIAYATQSASSSSSRDP